MVDDAEKARAADPQFLRDLRGLAQGSDRPWRIQLLNDDFGDGDFTRNPSWTVTAGKYWVDISDDDKVRYDQMFQETRIRLRDEEKVYKCKYSLCAFM